MTEQQAQSPIDDLFRKTFENLPDSAAESGWDTPSDRVWQHVQQQIPQTRKGWSTQAIALTAAFAVMLAIGLFWMLAQPAEKPSAPAVTPAEQPVVAPSATETQTNQPSDSGPKSSTGINKGKEVQGKTVPHNTTEEIKSKAGGNTAQPLPGSKSTLPPNTTEAQKKKREQD